jgi:hypothetical protein
MGIASPRGERTSEVGTLDALIAIAMPSAEMQCRDYMKDEDGKD